jgi:tight adherence protein C
MFMLVIAIFMAAAFGVGAVLMLRPALRPVGLDHPVAGTLPSAWRAAWPWLDYLAPMAASLLSWRSRRRLAEHALRAGMPHRFSAGHVAAAQWACAAFGTVCGTAIVAAMQQQADMRTLASGAITAALGAAMAPRLWLRGEIRRRAARMARELPFLLDMTTLCVESGLNLQGALQQAASQGPAGPLRDELLRALGDMRAGMPRLEALRAWSRRVDLPGVRALTVALAQADTLGMSLGPILRAQSERRHAERFNRAEKLAMQAPVKMLFPLIGCIFPCTFIVLAFPIAVQFWQVAR